MSDRYRFAALTGLAFVILVIVSLAVSGEPPDPAESDVQEIIDFYVDNKSAVFVSSLLEALAATMLVFFAGYLRDHLRAAEGGGGHWLSSLVLVGATIIAVGLAIDATINFALAETADDVDPAAVEALSALWSNDFIPIALGTQVLMLAAGIAVVMHGALPKWLGWIALLLGVLSVTPIGFVGVLGAALWIAVVSLLLTLRRPSPTPAGPAPPAAA